MTKTTRRKVNKKIITAIKTAISDIDFSPGSKDLNRETYKNILKELEPYGLTTWVDIFKAVAASTDIIPKDNIMIMMLSTCSLDTLQNSYGFSDYELFFSTATILRQREVMEHVADFFKLNSIVTD